jgi:CRP-like cAMP-binding protein
MSNPVEKIVTALHEAELWEGTLSLKRGDSLCMAGQVDRRLYFIDSGCIRIFFSQGEGSHSQSAGGDQEPTIRLGYSQNLIVAMDSFVSGQPPDLYLEAIKSSEVKYMSREVYMDFVTSDPELMNAWMRGIEGLVYQQLEREKDILTPSPQERLNRVLARSPQLFQEVPHKYIASYLRMTPETLSRLDKG